MLRGVLIGAACVAALSASPAFAQRVPFPAEFIAAMQAGRYAEAAQAIKPALDRCEAQAQRDECFMLVMGQGQALSMLPAQQHGATVIASFRRALDLADRFVGRDSAESIQAGQMLSMYLISQGKAQDALPVLERMSALARSKAGPGSELAQMMMSMQAFALTMLQRVPESFKVTDALIADLRSVGNVDGVLTAMLDRTEMVVGDKALAEKLRREIVAAPEFARSANAALKVKILTKLAQTLFENGNQVDAVDMNQRALALAASAKVDTAEAKLAREMAARYAQGGAVDRVAGKRADCDRARSTFGDRYAGAVMLCTSLGYDLLMDRRTEAEGLKLIRDNYAIAKADHRGESVFGMASMIMGLVNLVEGRLDEALRNYDDSVKVLNTYYAKSQDQIVLKALFARGMMDRPDLLARARVIARDVVDSAVLFSQSRAAFDDQSLDQLRTFSPMIRTSVKVNWKLYAAATAAKAR